MMVIVFSAHSSGTEETGDWSNLQFIRMLIVRRPGSLCTHGVVCNYSGSSARLTHRQATQTEDLI